MNSLSDARADARRLSRRGAALLLLAAFGGAALGLLGLLMSLRDASDLGLFAIVLTSLCTAMLLLFFGALGWHVGVRLTRQQLGDALREARLQNQALMQLQPDWQWATDAGHHLVRWQAPQGALASSWVGAAATQGLAERFVLDDGGDLGARLDARAAFRDLPVHARDGAPGHWLLRGQPCWDTQGRFAGYLGAAHPVAATEAAAPNPAWLAVLPGPAWLLGEEGCLIAQNEAACALGDGVTPGMNWAECVAHLPTALAEAKPQPFELDGRRYALIGLWSERAASGAAADAAAASEHESFGYTVSHDLRAPLRVVEGFTRILKEDYGRLLDRIGNDHLERVMGAAARMNSMIDALLSLAQLSSQPLARQPVNLSQLAGFIVEELCRGAPERLAEVRIEPQLVVQGDPTLLRMVLENLLGNAWKYSGKCAETCIRFESQTNERGQRVYVVSDNGAGFDMRFADRLFGVFQRLHSASDFQGTGVGLASVRRIVRRHGGEIWAESAVGEGARFYFTLG